MSEKREYRTTKGIENLFNENERFYLFVDNGLNSQNATVLLEDAGLQFVTHNVTQYDSYDFIPPMLFSPDGQFDTFDKIRQYIEMKYGKRRA